MRLVTILFALCLCGLTTAAEDLQLQPLSKYIQEISDSKNPDMSQMAYVGSRCAALYLGLASYIEANSRGPKDMELAKGLEKTALPYFQVSKYINLTANGMTEETINAQYKVLIEKYSSMMLESKRLNNEVMSPFITADIESAKTMFPVFKEMADNLTKKLEASGASK